MNNKFSASLVGLLLTASSITSSVQASYADGPAVLSTSSITTNFQNEMWTATFNADDSSFYFAEIGATGIHQVRTTDLMNSGAMLTPTDDGMGTFRAGFTNWQNAKMLASPVAGKDGHFWIYSASGNCSVTANQCDSPKSSGLWAIDTSAQNAVRRIPLLRANGEGQDGQLFGLAITPDGRYVYAMASKGSRNSGPDEAQIFKVDTATNTQIGLGFVVPFWWSALGADNQYVYGLSNGTYARVKINGDPTTSTGDQLVENLNIANGEALHLDDLWDFVLQGKYLISWAPDSVSCSLGAGYIGIVDSETGESKVIPLAPTVKAIGATFGGDGNLYAFDICHSTVIKIDPLTGQVLAQTAPMPEVGSLRTDWPFTAMSFDGSIFVVGGSKNGGLRAIVANPPRKATQSDRAVITGSSYQNQYLSATKGTWSAVPTATTSLQWYRCQKSVPANATEATSAQKCSKISGATSTRYKIGVEDAGMYITAFISATNSQGTTVSSAGSIRAKSLKAPTRLNLPVVSGKANKGAYLKTTVGTWAANPIVKTSIKWFRCEHEKKATSLPLSDGEQCVQIPKATKTKYKLSEADAGKFVTSQITATNNLGSIAIFATSKHVTIKPRNVTAPRISGLTVLGKTLTANAGTWDAFPSAKTSIGWYRCVNPTVSGSANFRTSMRCSLIHGVAGNKYTTISADKDKYISVIVKATNSAGTVLFTSDSTGKIG